MTDQLRDRIAAALRAAAKDCDGTCGLTETDCFEQHPIQVSVIHFDQIAGVYGYIDALAEVAAAEVQPELDCLRAENTELATELGARDDKARKRWIKNQEKQLGIRFADFRNGRWEMDLAMGREMAAAYVAMAKTLLGDGPNYSETKLEFDVKIAESPELYTLVVQRHAPGTLTPHEARLRAAMEASKWKAEAERLKTELDRVNEALRKAGIEHPLGATGVRDLAAQANGAREELDATRSGSACGCVTAVHPGHYPSCPTRTAEES